MIQAQKLQVSGNTDVRLEPKSRYISTVLLVPNNNDDSTTDKLTILREVRPDFYSVLQQRLPAARMQKLLLLDAADMQVYLASSSVISGAEQHNTTMERSPIESLLAGLRVAGKTNLANLAGCLQSA
eukprot:COSAG05_NODE_2510_length_2968_cov_4.077727_3_plen_127_part_00